MSGDAWLQQERRNRRGMLARNVEQFQYLGEGRHRWHRSLAHLPINAILKITVEVAGGVETSLRTKPASESLLNLTPNAPSSLSMSLTQWRSPVAMSLSTLYPKMRQNIFICKARLCACRWSLKQRYMDRQSGHFCSMRLRGSATDARRIGRTTRS